MTKKQAQHLKNKWLKEFPALAEWLKVKSNKERLFKDPLVKHKRVLSEASVKRMKKLMEEQGIGKGPYKSFKITGEKDE